MSTDEERKEAFARRDEAMDRFFRRHKRALGIGAVVAFVAVVIAICVVGVIHGKSTPDSGVAAMCEHIDRGDYQGAVLAAGNSGVPKVRHFAQRGYDIDRRSLRDGPDITGHRKRTLSDDMWLFCTRRGLT